MAFTYSLLASTTVSGSTTTTVTFNDIPQNYTDLVLKASVRGNNSNVYDRLNIAFNGSTTSFSGKFLEGTGASAISGTPGNANTIGYPTGSTATASTFANIEAYIPNYTGSTNKSISTDGVTENNATTAYVDLTATLWSNTTAITRIDLTLGLGTNFVANSTFYLYGIRATEY